MKPRNVSGGLGSQAGKAEEGKGGLQQFVVGMVMEKPLPFEDFAPLNGSRMVKKATGPLRSGSARPATIPDAALTRTVAGTGTCDLRINLLREFMVPNTPKQAPQKPIAAAPMRTLLEQNKSLFKPISIDPNAGPGIKANPSQVGGSRLLTKPALGVVTFGKDGVGTFGSRLQAFDTKGPSGSARKIQGSPIGTACFPQPATDSQGFRVFDEQISMALRSAERQASPTIPTQTEITEEDRIEEYSVVERSQNSRLTPAKSN